MPEPDQGPEASGKLCFLYRSWLQKTRFETIPTDVEDLFKRYSDENIMPKAKLKDFLIDDQNVPKDKAEASAQKIIASRNFKGFRNCSRHGLSRNGFLQFLLSNTNSPLVEEELKGEKELAHYFVYSSHRTYFKQEKKRQHLSNISNIKEDKTPHNSLKAIKKALKNGVKVIELDLFPSPQKTDIHVGQPELLRNQSSKILWLKDCLEAINEKAFYTSEFPLILILVEHFESELLSPQQASMHFESELLSPQQASMLRKKLKKWIDNIFGADKLCSQDKAFNKLTLDNLRNKIIVLKRPRTQQEHTSRDKNDLAEEENYVAGYVEEEEDQTQPRVDPGKATILRMKEDNLEKSEINIISFTQENLMIVSPKDKDHVKASNYDPLISWTRGIQMVAFNMQDSGKHLYIMQGLFRAQCDKTGKPTGYVKKPKILLNPSFDPTAWRPVREILKVKVYLGTGWHLDFGSEKFDKTSRPDFFTAVEIAGVPEDEAREKTIPASDQLIPFWDQEFEFPLTVPELAMLMIEVREFDIDRTHDFAGQTCLPVRQLRRGIRSVRLYDKKGKPYRTARLLMRFKFD